MRDFSTPAAPAAQALKILALLVASLLPSLAYSFDLDNRWTVTAHPGTGTKQGSPAIVTWSLVPDGTPIPGKPWLRPTESANPSNLIAFFDQLYGTEQGQEHDLTARPWFSMFSSAVNRWSELSGLTFLYEPKDDGAGLYATLFGSTIDGPPGQLNVRGDIRIGGHYIDGESGSNTLAYNSYPNAGEMVIDTSNTNFFGNTTSNSRAARNAIMHELGHGIGIRHRESSNSGFLMEPNITTAFDGPQFDDILAAHRWYGDVNEKSNNLSGNDAPHLATWLGAFHQSGQLAVGTNAAGTFVDANQTDFVSIDDETDIDFYRFSLPHPGVVSVQLIPRGPTYLEGPEGGSQTTFFSSMQSDLALAAYASNGLTLIDSADAVGKGGVESLSDLQLVAPGDYFLRISGADNAAQMYELKVQYSAAHFLPGDVNLDGLIDFSGNPETDDLLAFIRSWKRVLSTDDDLTAWSKGDLNLDRVSDLKDVFLMRRILVSHGMGNLVAALGDLDGVPVPEPAAGAPLAMICAALYLFQNRRLMS
jgi:serralysin